MGNWVDNKKCCLMLHESHLAQYEMCEDFGRNGEREIIQ